jgi:hypothetical protein
MNTAPAVEPFRVVQWTTGNVGERSVIAVLANPALELVGCYAWSPEKVGKDVGELCGVAPAGVTATNDVGTLLALQPDCVIYNPKWPNIDELVRILESGVNVVTTAAFITGHALGEGRPRIADACERGRSSIFGSGMNPGLANLLGIVSAGLCDRIDSITITESVDSTGYDSPDTELPIGFAKPLDDPALAEMTEAGTAVFGDAVRLVADALGLELDDVRCEAEYARTTEDLDLGSWRIEAGCVAGIAVSWQGIHHGRAVVALNARWRKGQHLEPDWKLEHGYLVDIQGQPCVRTRLEIYPAADFVASSFKDYMVLGMIMTALPAVNAIPQVCRADPGIVTYLDLPLVAPNGWVPS